MVVGYPGEKNGLLYEHTDTVISLKKTKLGGVLINYKIDATPG